MGIDYRYELKFVLDNAGLSHAMQWMCKWTHARKKYNKRKINNLYFDDLDFSSVNENLAGLPNRKKMRIRWYGFEKNTLPFFEVKGKNGRLVYKNSYPLNSLKNRLLELNVKEILSQCEKEMRLQQVIFDKYFVPTLRVNYDREYYEDLNGIRITFDENIQFYNSFPYLKLYEMLPVLYPYAVMEIKFDPHLKTKVDDLIRPLNISPKRHSKYLVGLANLSHAVYI